MPKLNSHSHACQASPPSLVSLHHPTKAPHQTVEPSLTTQPEILAMLSMQSQLAGELEKRRTQCPENWKERLPWLRAARAASVLQSLSVWPQMERMWPSPIRKVQTPPRRLLRELNAQAGRRSQFRGTPPTPPPAKPLSKRPWRHSAAPIAL